MPSAPVVTERDSRIALPERYREPWRERFDEAVRSRLTAGMTVLDVGSGRSPSLAPAERPAGVHWIGLDVSERELRRARPGDYDALVVSDLAASSLPLQATVDLAVSWQVLEHVRPLDQALANVHRSLRDGGAFVTLFSGSWSLFALVNRALPDRLGAAVVGRTMRRRGSAQPVFTAHYDRCYATALERVFADWSRVSIEPLYRGATYLHFSRALQAAYIAYENAVQRRRIGNLATHYFVVATK
jgi:SAM-dependent methyltransferase